MTLRARLSRHEITFGLLGILRDVPDDEVRGELGYSAAELSELKAAGAFG